jgi:molybdopterin molybdotransferase
VPDERETLAAVLGDAVTTCDVVVVSAGSSVGARDETAAVVAGLGEPGIWAHGIALRPGKPTLLADCGGVPVIGLPGNPRSALVVFRLVGMGIVRLVGGVTQPSPAPSARARLARDVPSAAGRLDIVQVSVRDGVATPLFGASALLSILTAADGFVVVPGEATGLDAGSEVDVTLYG